MSKKVIRILEEIVLPVFFIIFLFSSFLIQRSFTGGLHNLDLCSNERWINAEYGLDLKEIRLNGVDWSLEECYLFGLKTIYFSYWLGIFIFLGLGATIALIFRKLF